MVPQPVEQTGESTAGGGGDSHRSLPTPFLTKTYQLVDDPALDDVISWNEDGSTFIVWKPAEFARDLLPKYFKHNNFSSFVRQLNTYGFRKIVPDRWEFVNDCFRRGEKRLLCDIHRRKISPTVTATGVPVLAAAIPVVLTGSPSNSGEEQVLSSNSPPVAVSVSAVVTRTSCTTTSELLDENERLRRENQQLNQELTQMKGLCNNILLLMNNYANSQQDNNNNSNNNNNNSNNNNVGCSGCMGEKQFDLMPIRHFVDEFEAVPGSVAQNTVKMEEEMREMIPRLFGVPIGSKRSRREEVDEQEQEQQHQQQQQIGSEGVKSEPLDVISSQPESTWMNDTCRSNERRCK